jgi:hypothetical protein
MQLWHYLPLALQLPAWLILQGNNIREYSMKNWVQVEHLINCKLNNE